MIEDYKKLERSIVDRLLHGDGPKASFYIIFSEDKPYGFGNNFRSLLASVLIALISGKRLRSRGSDNYYYYLVDWDNYYSFMDNEFIQLRFNVSKGDSLKGF